MNTPTPTKAYKSLHQWLKILWIALFHIVALRIAWLLLAVLSVYQIFYNMITNHPSTKVQSFIQSLTEYIRQCCLYVTFQVNEAPFPAQPWPSSGPSSGPSSSPSSGAQSPSTPKETQGANKSQPQGAPSSTKPKRTTRKSPPKTTAKKKDDSPKEDPNG